MPDAKPEQASSNWCFTYRHINHVASKKEFPNEDDHKAAVIDKFRSLDAKKRVAATPIVEPVREKKTVVVETVAEQPEPVEAVEVPDDKPFKVRKSGGIGWFIVEGPDGKPITEKPVRREVAEKIAEQANEAAPLEDPEQPEAA